MLGGGVIWTSRAGAGRGNGPEEKTGGRRKGSTASRGDLTTTSPGQSRTGAGERGGDAGQGRMLVERGRGHCGDTSIASRTTETEKQEEEEEVGGGERKEADGLEGGRSQEGRSIRPGSRPRCRLGMDLSGGPVLSATTPTSRRISSPAGAAGLPGLVTGRVPTAPLSTPGRSSAATGEPAGL